MILNGFPGGGSNITKTATITTNWTGTTPPYTQTINVAGITTADNPMISPIYSDVKETAVTEMLAWEAISTIKTNTGYITCTCYNRKPLVPINIQIK